MGKYYSATWGKALSRAVGANFTPQVDLFLRAWAQSESGDPTQSEGGVWNPFNTTQKMPGSTDFNVNGGYPVQNYLTWQQGVQATAKTILNGHYPALVADLRLGTSALAMAHAVAVSSWGTGGLITQVLTKGGPKEFGIGKCYYSPAAPFNHFATKIRPGDQGADVDELLRALGGVHKWYDTKDPAGNPVAKVKQHQLLRPWLYPADGVVGPKTFKSITGHA